MSLFNFFTYVKKLDSKPQLSCSVQSSTLSHFWINSFKKWIICIPKDLPELYMLMIRTARKAYHIFKEDCSQVVNRENRKNQFNHNDLSSGSAHQSEEVVLVFKWLLATKCYNLFSLDTKYPYLQRTKLQSLAPRSYLPLRATAISPFSCTSNSLLDVRW